MVIVRLISWLINFSSKRDLQLGDIVKVKITSAKTWSLDGEEVE